MIIWFLRLFSVFRATEGDLVAAREALDELSTEKLLLQDRLDAALADKDKLWSTMQDALDNERAALRSQVNHAVQKTGGGIPYPDAHFLPAGSVREVQASGPIGRRGRLLPSEAAQRQTGRFLAEEFNQPR